MVQGGETEMKQESMRWATALAAVLAAGTVLAVEAVAPAEAKRTEITAGHLNFDYERMQALFEDKVVVKDPSMILESDKLWVVMDQASQQITSAKATGGVKITEKDRVATGDQAEYNAREGKLVLTGNAVVQRGLEVLRGTKITFWRGDNRIECERPTLILFPAKGQSLQGMIQ
jgi:lipopolysaccharide export system protein LptA